jgi:hypothetical protein
MNPTQKALLEKRDGWDVGRDPRQVSRDELIAAGHKPTSALNALRARCIDCKAGELSEVRRCAHLDCPAWPYRMGTNPWQSPISADVLEARRRGGRKRAAQFEKSAQGTGSVRERKLPAARLPAEPSARRNPSPEQNFRADANVIEEAVR